MVKALTVIFLVSLLSPSVLSDGLWDFILNVPYRIQCAISVLEDIGSEEILEPAFQNLLGIYQQIWNCDNDCVCIHGYYRGDWVHSTSTYVPEVVLPYCICSNEPTNNDTLLEEKRISAGCSGAQFAVILAEVCATHTTCDADCNCAHNAKNGTRKYNADGTYQYCHCNY